MRIKAPDKKSALSLLTASENQMEYTLTIQSTDSSAFTIIRNIYECFQMIGKSVLLAEGKVSEDHVESLNAIESLNMSLSRPLKIIDNLRQARHGINYYGYVPSKQEADDAVVFAKDVFYEILKAAKEKIK